MRLLVSGFYSRVFVFLALFCVITHGLVQSDQNDTRRDFITWEDFKIFDRTDLNLRDVTSRERIIVVDVNGTGDSVTVQGAVDMVQPNNAERVKIHILPGIYREKVRIPANKPYISLIGDLNDTSSTVITWHDRAGDKGPFGTTLGTWNSASVTVESDYFCASGITFENTVVQIPGRAGNQAVAFRIAGEKAMFYKVRFVGAQDTLLDDTGTHYFYNCFIQGSVDFIFGNARSLYQECNISVMDNGYAVAAHHRNSDTDDTGFSFVNCTLTGTANVYLGRAWGNYSRIIYSYTELDIEVRPQGWNDWRDPSRRTTVMFGEYECRGKGADRSGRVAWSKALNDTEAKPFLDTAYISGDQWLRL